MPYEQFKHGSGKNEKNIFLVDMKNELNPFYSDLMVRGINKTLKKHAKIAIIANKKSYAHGIICNDCGHIPQCENCKISIAYHQPNKQTNFGMCHICKTTYKIVKKCPQCGSTKLKYYGVGIEQIAEWLEQNHNIKPLTIKSETANSLAKIKRLYSIIETYEAIIGTSLLKTPPVLKKNVELLIIQNADAGLNIPDYEANKNNFHYIYDIIQQRQETPNIIIQTQKPESPSIRFAFKYDLEGFNKRDGEFRKKHHYPPVAELCVLSYKHKIEKNVFSSVNKLYQELLYHKEKQYSKDNIDIYATPPLIYKSYNKYRYNIVIKGAQIRKFIDESFTIFKIDQRGFKLDRQAREII